MTGSEKFDLLMQVTA